MKKVIASIKLAPGNRGYFDPLTGINLSVSNNIGYIREGDNLDNIRRDIKQGKIKIVGGKLSPAINIEPKKEQPVKEEKKVEKRKPKKEIAQLFKVVEPVAIKQEEKKAEVKEAKKEEPVAKKKPLIPMVQEKKEENKKEAKSVVIDTKDKQKLEQASEKPVEKAGE